MGDIAQPNSRIRLRPWLPGLAIIWGGALWSTMAWPRAGSWLAAVLGAVIALMVWRWLPSRPRWLLPGSLLWFCWSSLAAVGVIGSQNWQYVVLLMSVGLLGWQLAHDQANPQDRTSTRLTHLLAAVSLFFSWLVFLSFGVGIVWLLAWWWLPIGGALLTTLAASLVWSAAGLDGKRYRGSLVFTAFVGGSFMLATWWLPTVVLVGSIIAMTAIMLWLLTLRHVWLGTWEAGRGRRYLIVGSSIIGLLLVTARWS